MIVEKKSVQNVSVFDMHCGLKESLNHFFLNGAGLTLTVNDEHYHNITTQFLVPQLKHIALEDMWFQQVGATTCESLNVFHESFVSSVVFRVLWFQALSAFHPWMTGISQPICNFI